MARFPLALRFWSKVDRRGPDDCWPWLGKTRQVYGAIKISGKNVSAHRVAYELANGPISPGARPHDACVCHSCDNPKCCNPGHLWLGTQQENVTDRQTKGRAGSHKGSNNGRAKLDEAAVSLIRSKRSAGATITRLGAEFGVYPSTIARACKSGWETVSG